MPSVLYPPRKRRSSRAEVAALVFVIALSLVLWSLIVAAVTVLVLYV